MTTKTDNIFQSNEGDNVQAGLLLPAVQSVREAARRTGDEDTFDETQWFGVEEGGEELLIGLLLPAVQKAQGPEGELDLTIGDDGSTEIGLLLPAVQKAREASAPADKNGSDEFKYGTDAAGETVLDGLSVNPDAAAASADNHDTAMDMAG